MPSKTVHETWPSAAREHADGRAPLQGRGKAVVAMVVIIYGYAHGHVGRTHAQRRSHVVEDMEPRAVLGGKPSRGLPAPPVAMETWRPASTFAARNAAMGESGVKASMRARARWYGSGAGGVSGSAGGAAERAGVAPGYAGGAAGRASAGVSRLPATRADPVLPGLASTVPGTPESKSLLMAISLAVMSDRSSSS